MNAPTEEEIRAAIAREWRRPPRRDSITGEPIGLPIGGEYSDGVGACLCLLDGLFDLDKLRESEVDRLHELTFAAVDPIRDETQRRIVEALVAAGLAFAAEHPSAPRAARERVTA